jgi:hypothetical protein
LGWQAQEKKYCPEYELEQSYSKVEKLLQAEKTVEQKSIFSDTTIEESSGVVIAEVVSVSQALFQTSRSDWKLPSRSVLPMHNRSSS